LPASRPTGRASSRPGRGRSLDRAARQALTRRHRRTSSRVAVALTPEPARKPDKAANGHGHDHAGWGMAGGTWATAGLETTVGLRRCGSGQGPRRTLPEGLAPRWAPMAWSRLLWPAGPCRAPTPIVCRPDRVAAMFTRPSGRVGRVVWPPPAVRPPVR